MPLVYALLTRKTSDQYVKVLQAMKAAVDEYHVPVYMPTRFMSDFEKGIHNACAEVYPNVNIKCCFFHLGQSLYRRIQETGLQVQYRDENDRRIKNYTHILLAVAFVPVDDVPTAFNLLRGTWREDDFKPVLDYFGKTYVHGVPAKGRRRAVAPRYSPASIMPQLLRRTAPTT